MMEFQRTEGEEKTSGVFEDKIRNSEDESINTNIESPQKESQPKKAGKKIIAGGLLYLLALGLGEVVINYYSVEYGLTIHAGIMLVMIFLSSYVKDEKLSNLLQSLAIPPLIRILSTSIPLLVFLNQIYQFLLIYLPLLLAAFLVIRNQKMKAEDVGITSKKLKLQMLIALSGIIFGVVEYFILKDYILPVDTTNLLMVLIYIFIVMLFTGFGEELIFRGIILTNTTKILSANKSIILVSVLFMLLHMGWKSPADLVFVFVVSLFYCYVFLKTKSVVGVSLSHGITNVVQYVVLPVVLPLLIL